MKFIKFLSVGVLAMLLIGFCSLLMNHSKMSDDLKASVSFADEAFKKSFYKASLQELKDDVIYGCWFYASPGNQISIIRFSEPNQTLTQKLTMGLAFGIYDFSVSAEFALKGSTVSFKRVMGHIGMLNDVGWILEAPGSNSEPISTDAESLLIKTPDMTLTYTKIECPTLD